jgi:preprotein translocase subunit SecA
MYDLFTYTNKMKGSDNIFNSKLQQLLRLPFNNDSHLIPSTNTNTLTPLLQQFQIAYSLKEIEVETVEVGLMRELERAFLLEQIDFAWKEHLQKIAFLKDFIRWRSYGQKNPLTEYKGEAFNLFTQQLIKIRHRVIYFVLNSKLILS